LNNHPISVIGREIRLGSYGEGHLIGWEVIIDLYAPPPSSVSVRIGR